MDKSGILVGATVGSISVFIIFSIFFIIPDEPDEMTIQMQNQIDENELQVQSQIAVSYTHLTLPTILLV